jgi:ABC-type phosphate transport system auxiliary subunit
MTSPERRAATTAQLDRLRARRQRAKLQGQMCLDRVRELDAEIERLQARLTEATVAQT